MATTRRPSTTKRLRERAQKERQEHKAQRRAQRKADREAGNFPVPADETEVSNVPAESAAQE